MSQENVETLREFLEAWDPTAVLEAFGSGKQGAGARVLPDCFQARLLGWLLERPKSRKPRSRRGLRQAADGIRTHDLLHGKQTL
jgi:hypothetical protein